MTGPGRPAEPADRAVAMSSPDSSPASRNRRAPAARSVATVAVVALAIAAVGAAWWFLPRIGGEPDVQVAAADPSLASQAPSADPTIAAASLTTDEVLDDVEGERQCEGPLPHPLPPLDGYDGPFLGPAATSSFGAGQEPGQTIVHWDGGPYAVDLAWPPHRSPAGEPWLREPERCAHVGIWVESREYGFGGGEFVRVDDVADASDLGATITRIVAEAVEGTGSGALDVPQPPDQPYLTGDVQVDELPTDPGGCRGGDLPNTSGTGSSIPYPSADEAVEAYVSRDAPLPFASRPAWLRLVDSEGSAVYALPDSMGGTYTVLVWAAETPEGWVVDRWEGPGC